MKMIKKEERNDFKINDLVFAKVRGFPFWPAKITGIKEEKYKKSAQFEVTFFSTYETGTVNKTDLCHYSQENILKYSLESVANKHKISYRKAEVAISKEKLDKQTILSPSNFERTPLSNKNGISKNSRTLVSSVPSLSTKDARVKFHSKSAQTEIIEIEERSKKHLQHISDKKLFILLSLLENKWVTDDTIQLYYDSLTSTVLRSNNKVLLMNPVVTQALKCLPDVDHIITPLELTKKTYVFSLFTTYSLKKMKMTRGIYKTYTKKKVPIGALWYLLKVYQSFYTSIHVEHII